jgi:hypothetical protein
VLICLGERDAAIVAYWPIATESPVPWNVGNQGKSGLVVLNVSFVARDPQRTLEPSPWSVVL